MKFTLNGQGVELSESDAPPEMPLLWALRDVLKLTGTKFGCGVAACGACTVQIEGQATRACVTPLSAVEGKRVRTVEGLASGEQLHALQLAWIEHQVPQCGYCQSGLLMAAAGLLERGLQPTDAEIDAAITNLCRCGTVTRVRAAIRTAAQTLKAGTGRQPDKRASAVAKSETAS